MPLDNNHTAELKAKEEEGFDQHQGGKGKEIREEEERKKK